MLKVELTSIKAHVKMHWTSSGSVMAGTISSKCHAAEMDVEVESPDDAALVAALVHAAKGGCYAESALMEPVPITSRVSLNGEPFDYTAFPKKAPRKR